jgi:YVTN family beta-propeller protein
MRGSTPALLVCALLLTSCRQHDFPAYPRNYREFAYVTNSGSNTVTVLDVVNLRQDRVIAVGRRPVGIAANPARNEVYAVNADSGSVSVIDAISNQVTATIPVDRLPYSIDVAPDGRTAYVANSGANNISVIDLDRRRVMTTIGVGEGPGVARVAQDGSAIVVSNEKSGSVSVIDPKLRRVRAFFSGCPGATAVTLMPDSTKAFIACSGGRQVMVIGLARPASAGASAKPDRLLALLVVGATPTSIALKPDSGEAFTTNFDGNSISEIATYTNEVGGTYQVGMHPSQGVVTRDNALLWVSDFGSGTVSLYSIEDGRLIENVAVGEGPDALALSSAGHLLMVVNSRSNDLAVVRTKTHGLFTLLPLGRKPSSIAVKAYLVR